MELPPAIAMTPDEAAAAAEKMPPDACAPAAARIMDQSAFEMLNAIIGNRYHLVHGIGRGKYGKVYEARDLHTAEPVAVKVIMRIELPTDRQRKAEREWIVASKLHHPNVIQLRDVQVSEDHVFLVMELASGSELFERVSRSGGLPEEQARMYFHQVVSGISYCHHQGVYHRDLKLENLLMASETSDQVKIMDFGFSKDSTMSVPKTYCGTISYMAPEVTDLVAGTAVYDGAKADIWSLGVILYVTVCCSYPFGHDGRPELGGESAHVVYQRIRSRTFKEGREELARCASPALQELIEGMLTVDAGSRLDIDAILAHPWLQVGPRYEPLDVVPLADSSTELQVHWPTSSRGGGLIGLGQGGGGGGSGSSGGGLADMMDDDHSDAESDACSDLMMDDGLGGDIADTPSIT